MRAPPATSVMTLRMTSRPTSAATLTLFESLSLIEVVSSTPVTQSNERARSISTLLAILAPKIVIVIAVVVIVVVVAPGAGAVMVRAPVLVPPGDRGLTAREPAASERRHVPETVPRFVRSRAQQLPLNPVIRCKIRFICEA